MRRKEQDVAVMHQEKRRKEQDVAVMHQKKRRKHKIKLGVASAVLIIIAVTLILAYFKLSKNEYNTYTENAKVNYKVSLKENEFYRDQYVDGKSTIIASLIKDIDVNFDYKMNLANEQDYTYEYKILAKTNVKESSKSNSIYETTDELVNSIQQESNSKDLEIADSVTINYDDYNEKINKFINLYRLDNVTSTLQLEMDVYVINKYDGKQINEESKIMTVDIPLTTKTINISIDSNVVQGEGKILSKKSEYQNPEYFLWAGIALAIIGIIIFIMLIKYIIEKRSAETMYAQELKQILFNYKSYIQRSNTPIDTKGYKIISINTFEEILGLRDTMQAPILMYTEEEEERTKFMILSDKIMYIYVLGAKEIREELRAKSAERQKRKNS